MYFELGGREGGDSFNLCKLNQESFLLHNFAEILQFSGGIHILATSQHHHYKCKMTEHQFKL